MKHPERRCNGIIHFPEMKVESCGETATVVCSGPGLRPLQWYACEKPEHGLNEDGTVALRMPIADFFAAIYRGMAPENSRNSRMK